MPVILPQNGLRREENGFGLGLGLGRFGLLDVFK